MIGAKDLLSEILFGGESFGFDVGLLGIGLLRSVIMGYSVYAGRVSARLHIRLIFPIYLHVI